AGVQEAFGFRVVPEGAGRGARRHDVRLCVRKTAGRGNGGRIIVEVLGPSAVVWGGAGGAARVGGERTGGGGQAGARGGGGGEAGAGSWLVSSARATWPSRMWTVRLAWRAMSLSCVTRMMVRPSL